MNFRQSAAALLALWGCSSALAEIDLPRLARTSRPAVVLLTTFNSANQELKTGTGFFIGTAGPIVTNRHVIAGAATVTAKMESGAYYLVKGVVAEDAASDIAVLKADALGVPILSLGSSDRLEIGSPVAVIGSPLGLEGTVSNGIFSARRPVDGAHDFLQITAPISPGSSGSPVINEEGDVDRCCDATVQRGPESQHRRPRGSCEVADHRRNRTKDSSRVRWARTGTATDSPARRPRK